MDVNGSARAAPRKGVLVAFQLLRRAAGLLGGSRLQARGCGEAGVPAGARVARARPAGFDGVDVDPAAPDRAESPRVAAGRLRQDETGGCVVGGAAVSEAGYSAGRAALGVRERAKARESGCAFARDDKERPVFLRHACGQRRRHTDGLDAAFVDEPQPVG